MPETVQRPTPNTIPLSLTWPQSVLAACELRRAATAPEGRSGR